MFQNKLTDKFQTIEEFFKFMNTSFEFGWVDELGNKYLGVNNQPTKYSLQSPEELINSKICICWDNTELCREYFTNINLKNETYFIYYNDGKGDPCHTIIVFYNNDKIYWFEPFATWPGKFDYSGIYEYNNLSELLIDFKKRFIEQSILLNNIPKDYNEKEIYCFKYEKPNYHINCNQFYNHCKNGTKIKI